MPRNPKTTWRTVFRGHEVVLGGIIIYDDPNLADQFADELRTEAKHSASKFENPHWHTFSVVRLP